VNDDVNNPLGLGTEGFYSHIEIRAKINGLCDRHQHRKIKKIYQRARQKQWDPDIDIYWQESVGYKGYIKDNNDYGLNEFSKSSIGKGGKKLFDEFRWELQFWLVSQFLYGEQAALVSSSKLVMSLDHNDHKLMAASQVYDEAKHVEVFSRYVESYIDEPYELSPTLKSILDTALEHTEWDMSVLGMQVLIEGLADATFRMGASTFHDNVIQSIIEKVAIDESRHVAFGVVLLKDMISEMSSSEKNYRKEFLLDAACAIHQRFMLEEVWERVDVSKSKGVSFAKESQLMIDFRRVAFSKIYNVVNKIGLMDKNLHNHLYNMQLVR